MRQAIRQAAGEGLTWQSVLDAVRAQGQAIWAALPLAERRRLIRHVRPYWDVHRFRIAPQVEDVIDRAHAEGRLETLAASVASVEKVDGAYRVQLRPRGQSEPRHITVDAIVVTTGPAHGGILSSQPFLAELAQAGVLQPCPTGLGIACTRTSHALSHADAVVDDLLIAGPLARGTFGELMGLPQVTEHAALVAGQLESLVTERLSLSRQLPRAS